MIISDTFVTRILRNISCALGKQSLYSRWKFISTFTELHGHGDERWPRSDVKYVFPLTNGSDVKYVLPRCPKLVKCPRKEDSLRREKEKKKTYCRPREPNLRTLVFGASLRIPVQLISYPIPARPCIPLDRVTRQLKETRRDWEWVQ